MKIVNLKTKEKLPDFLTGFWEKIIRRLKAVSVFELVKHILRKMGYTAGYEFVDVWVLLNGFAAVLSSVLIYKYGGQYLWLGIVCSIYGAERIFEIIVYQIYVVLFEPFEGGYLKPDYHIKSAQRMLLLLVHNYVEVMFWYTSIMLTLLYVNGGSPNGSWVRYVANQILCILTLDKGRIDLLNNNVLKVLDGLAFWEVVTGAIMTMISIARFLGMLPAVAEADRGLAYYEAAAGMETETKQETSDTNPDINPEAVVSNRVGVTDEPCILCGSSKSDTGTDLLEIGKDIGKLEKFIESCNTPMSIAIQGEWGTGKTTVMKTAERYFEDKKYTTIYFNTWQYSQFNMQDSLYLSFMTCLIKRLGNSAELTSFMNKVIKLAVPFLQMAGRWPETLNADLIQEIMHEQSDSFESISKMKMNFEEQVRKHLADNGDKNRIIIFIDDLDRLEPIKAVELLEVIKIFLDVPCCVFVMAVDYDVILRGIRKKLGEDTPYEKCKEFFDKMIQLPFQMPVENYDMKGMMNEYLNMPFGDGYKDILSEFSGILVKGNPRNFKRIVNAYLFNSIDDRQKQQKSGSERYIDSLVFCAICLQTSIPELYSYLCSNTEWYGENGFFDNSFILRKVKEELVEDFNEGGLFRDSDDPYWIRVKLVLKTLGITLKKVNMIAGNGYTAARVFEDFAKILKSSYIPDVQEETIWKVKKEAQTVNSIRVFGQNYFVNKLSSATVKTVELVLNQYPSCVDQCLKELLILTEDSTKKNSVFRSKVSIDVGGRTIWIGNSTDFDDKKLYMDKMSRICSLKDEDICWMDDDDVIYRNMNEQPILVG